MRITLIVVRGEEKKKVSGSKIAAILVGMVTLGCAAFVVVLFLVKALWAWTVPDLLPGAVHQGLVAGSISRLTAAKVAVFIAVLSGFSGGTHVHATRKK